MIRTPKFIPALALAVLLISLCACTVSMQTETLSTPTGSPTQSEANIASPDAPSDVPPTTAQQPNLTVGNQDDTTESDTTPALSGEVIISFDYEKISGSASNQWAIWVEDMDGNYINTLFATKWTAVGGYETRPDSIAIWVAKSGIATMPDYYADAISGATPKASGGQSYAWNLKDINGDTVLPGEYRFIVEGTLRWKNYVIYSGVIEIGYQPATVQADAEYFYEASDRYAVLTSESPENAMIGAVAVSFIPAADS